MYGNSAIQIEKESSRPRPHAKLCSQHTTPQNDAWFRSPPPGYLWECVAGMLHYQNYTPAAGFTACFGSLEYRENHRQSLRSQ